VPRPRGLEHTVTDSHVAGEYALANLSVEKTANGLMGHVRIRAKTQGIALSLGDRITMGVCFPVYRCALTESLHSAERRQAARMSRAEALYVAYTGGIWRSGIIIMQEYATPLWYPEGTSLRSYGQMM
jgi:hypothetical protein